MNSLGGSQGYSGLLGGNKIPKGYQQAQLQQYTPEQMQLFQQGFGSVSPDSYTSRLAQGDPSLFGEMEAPALKQFSGLQGNIASRFSGMGLGGRKSSGFQNEMNSAASDFAQQLQSRRQELQRGAIKDLHGMSQDLLGNRPYEQFLEEEKESKPWWKSLLGGALPVAGAAFGMTPFGMASGGPAVWGGLGKSAGQAF